MTKSEPVRIGLLGYGTVGSGVLKLLHSHAEMLAQKLGRPIEAAALAALNARPNRALGITWRQICGEPGDIVSRPDIDIVVELFGGHEPARSLILRALAAGKDVVTANKALLAEHGEEIFRAAYKSGCTVGFEASVGGGIPIIRTLREGLAGDRQRALHGIVNGTCNFILTTMAEERREFTDALALAQQNGLAEADPSLDIDGYDTAHKLSLLVALAFGHLIKPAQIHTEGIRLLTQYDIAYARELGYTIKLLAIAKNDNQTIEARVHPTMISRNHLLASVSGPYNAIYVHSEALGSTMYYGQGAGQMPTATAVVADIMQIARERLLKSGSRPHPLGYPMEALDKAHVKPMDDLVCEYYLRFSVQDKPGVLGKIASILGHNEISIASVIQQDHGGEVTVPVVMRTHEAREKHLKRALSEIYRLKMVKAKPVFVRIEEHL